MAQLRFDELGADQQRLTRSRRNNSAGATVQYLGPNLILKLLQALADGRLREMQILGSLTERARLNHRNEISQLNEFHSVRL